MCGLALAAPPLNGKPLPDRFVAAAGPYKVIMQTTELVPQPT